MTTAATPLNPARAKMPKPVHVQQGVMHGTPATRQIHAIAMSPSGGTAVRRRSSSGKKKAAPRTPRSSPRSARAARSGKSHLVKGSAAAKKRMAQLRAMVGKAKKAA